MSNFSIPFIRDLGPEAEWREGGYLFIVPPAAMHVLEENCAVQRANGAEVRLMTRGELAAAFPSMRVDDLGGGVRYIPERVCGLRLKGSTVGAVVLESGGEIAGEFRGIDLTRFGYGRVLRGEPYAERGIV